MSARDVATDACSDCAKYKIRITDPNLTETEKRMESASFLLHRRRARMFYDLLGRVAEGHVTLCFDMLQNMVLPKTPIGQAYYSRQMYLYLFGVVVHHGVVRTVTRKKMMFISTCGRRMRVAKTAI